MKLKWIISAVVVLFSAFLINDYEYKIQRMYEWVIHEDPLMPLEGAIITQPYGNFVDPVNKQKIFKNFVTMQSKEDKNVFAMLDGRVVAIDSSTHPETEFTLASESRLPSLRTIVVIEHKNGLYSVYGKLATLSPTIKKGTILSKGDTIGTVANELIWSVIKEDEYINPMGLFKE